MMKAIISFVAGVMLWGDGYVRHGQTERKFIREGNDFLKSRILRKRKWNTARLRIKEPSRLKLPLTWRMPCISKKI